MVQPTTCKRSRVLVLLTQQHAIAYHKEIVLQSDAAELAELQR